VKAGFLLFFSLTLAAQAQAPGVGARECASLCPDEGSRRRSDDRHRAERAKVPQSCGQSAVASAPSVKKS
jgi:hypothetical protein